MCECVYFYIITVAPCLLYKVVYSNLLKVCIIIVLTLKVFLPAYIYINSLSTPEPFLTWSPIQYL